MHCFKNNSEVIKQISPQSFKTRKQTRKKKKKSKAGRSVMHSCEYM